VGFIDHLVKGFNFKLDVLNLLLLVIVQFVCIYEIRNSDNEDWNCKDCQTYEKSHAKVKESGYFEIGHIEGRISIFHVYTRSHAEEHVIGVDKPNQRHQIELGQLGRVTAFNFVANFGPNFSTRCIFSLVSFLFTTLTLATGFEFPTAFKALGQESVYG
jgi:hypothetical protein